MSVMKADSITCFFSLLVDWVNKKNPSVASLSQIITSHTHQEICLYAIPTVQINFALVQD